MKIAVAQNRPIVGDVNRNVAGHLALATIAVDDGAEIVVFPELSLTGYEPKRAAELARNPDDVCFDELQAFCNDKKVAMGVGVPLKTAGGLPLISTLVFRAGQNPLVYSKMFLHSDELSYFSPGNDSSSLIFDDPRIALAICFELSVPQHAQRAIEAGAAIYIASVAKTASGVVSASQRLSEIAEESSMLVLMANCLGQFDGEECTGLSAVWGRCGEMLAHLDGECEGVIVVDSVSGESAIRNLPPTVQRPDDESKPRVDDRSTFACLNIKNGSFGSILE